MRVQGDPANDGVYFLLSDHLGSTSVIADENGNKVGELRYKPWGESRYAEGAALTDYRFTGQRLDEETGLYFYGSRWYDP